MNLITYTDLILAGLALVSMPAGTKGPTKKGWNQRKNCINKISQVGLLERMNVGLAHAYCEPNPTGALDIDNFKHAKPLLTLHGICLDKLIHAPDAVVIWSGKKYSLKLIYRLPYGEKPLESKKLSGPDGKSAIEFRCATKNGLTVQDVLPPSIHPDGHQYEWYGAGDPLNPPQIPVEVLNLWKNLIVQRKSGATKKIPSIGTYSSRPETPREIATLRLMLCFINADRDYESWRDIVWSILSTGWSCAEEIAYEWSTSAKDCFKEHVFWKVVNSYRPDHESKITYGTLKYYALLGGWND